LNIVYSCGDTNGIGPELVFKTLRHFKNKQKGCKKYFVIPRNVFLDTANITPLDFQCELIDSFADASADKQIVSIVTLPDVKLKYGSPNAASGKASIKALEIAYAFIKANPDTALVTAPISKEAVKKAGYKYPGHTEMLAGWSGTENFVMMFLSKKMKGALLTIHEPIAEVSSLLTKEFIEAKVRVIIHSLQNDFGKKTPKVALLGLNPHAGENGNIGREEKEIFSVVIKKFKNIVEGPFPADAFFGMQLFKKYDCVISPYHDQLLIPFKLLSFDDGVNFTAGLPFIRTSPDHGTAYNIAGKGVASAKSIIAAADAAYLLLKKRKHG
jgi:4-hydroxythreonine-4-phosphate dehydrogenase